MPEGIEIDVSTLRDRVGACVVALDPIIQALWAHVLSAERIHADDTTVPVLAKMKTATADLTMSDDRPFGGKTSPAAASPLLAVAPGTSGSAICCWRAYVQADAWRWPTSSTRLSEAGADP